MLTSPRNFFIVRYPAAPVRLYQLFITSFQRPSHGLQSSPAHVGCCSIHIVRFSPAGFLLISTVLMSGPFRIAIWCDSLTLIFYVLTDRHFGIAVVEELAASLLRSPWGDIPIYLSISMSLPQRSVPSGLDWQFGSAHGMLCAVLVSTRRWISVRLQGLRRAKVRIMLVLVTLTERQFFLQAWQ